MSAQEIYETCGTQQTVTDYARDIDELLREEGERIRRILKVIDESMVAIHKTREIINKR